MTLAGQAVLWTNAPRVAFATVMFAVWHQTPCFCSSSNELCICILLMQSWVHEYKEDRTHALASLLTFFVQVAAGHMAHHVACRQTHWALNA